MSKGVFGQHADDPQWVFIAWEPVPGPRWMAVLAVVMILVVFGGLDGTFPSSAGGAASAAATG